MKKSTIILLPLVLILGACSPAEQTSGNLTQDMPFILLDDDHDKLEPVSIPDSTGHTQYIIDKSTALYVRNDFIPSDNDTELVLKNKVSIDDIEELQFNNDNGDEILIRKSPSMNVAMFEGTDAMGEFTMNENIKVRSMLGVDDLENTMFGRVTTKDTTNVGDYEYDNKWSITWLTQESVSTDEDNDGNIDWNKNFDFAFIHYAPEYNLLDPALTTARVWTGQAFENPVRYDSEEWTEETITDYTSRTIFKNAKGNLTVQAFYGDESEEGKTAVSERESIGLYVLGGKPYKSADGTYIAQYDKDPYTGAQTFQTYDEKGQDAVIRVVVPVDTWYGNGKNIVSFIITDTNPSGPDEAKYENIVKALLPE